MRALETSVPIIDLRKYLDVIENTETIHVRGRVTEVTGLVIKATIPGVRIGELCYIETGSGHEPIACEVVGFKDEAVMLMPLGEAKGIGPESEVIPTGQPFRIKCGYGLLGRILDGLGQPIDGGPPLDDIEGLVQWDVERTAPDPMKRMRITEHIAMGVRALDGLLTVGLGQRIGLFAGSGVGKSTLMGQIARNCEAEVVVTCLVGERGREVRDYIEEALGSGLQKSVLVVATSNAPSLVRLKSTFVATAIAEWFRDQGKKVLFMMDSATRFARAQREVGLAIGEPPARQGYPPSVFAQIPRLMERTGNNETGSITAIYTILVQAGDMDEPIADEVRGILDGHIILNRALGARNHWPAVDILPSLSRVMVNVASPEHKKAASKLREVLSTYEKQRDLILLGAYQYGTDAKTDYAIDKIDEIETFLRQSTHDCDDFHTTVQKMIDIFADARD